MASQKIYIVSPDSPTGAAWLINCFLELGIKTYRAPLDNMWEVRAGKFFLRPGEEILKKWLPALSSHDSFEFKEGVEVEWVHDWPHAGLRGSRVIFFTRDPRDSIFSYYRRIKPQQSFEEFVDFLNPRTLLNRLEDWRLYHLCWYLRGGFRSFRFEDYKKNDKALLSEILVYAGLHFDPMKIAKAAEASTFEKAAAAETTYRSARSDDPQIINQEGAVGQWQGRPELSGVIDEIAARTSSVMRLYGYDIRGGSEELPAGSGDLADYSLHFKYLSFLRSLDLDPKAWESSDVNPKALQLLSVTVTFIQSLDKERLGHAKLQSHEVPILSESILGFLDQWHQDRRRHWGMAPMDKKQAPRSGTVYWFTGLSGAGKTTLGKLFYARLKRSHRPVIFLDGNELREMISEDLGHDAEDRKKSAMRNARLCKLLADQGLDVVCSTISLWHECQRWNRSHNLFYKEIHVRAPLHVLAQRDHRKIYAEAANGRMKNVWGVDLKPEEPENPDRVIENDGSQTPEEIVDALCNEFLDPRKSES